MKPTSLNKLRHLKNPTQENMHMMPDLYKSESKSWVDIEFEAGRSYISLGKTNEIREGIICKTEMLYPPYDD